jgi:type I restriction enzyme S subunit
MGKYKKYEKYKPSGLEWLGDIPEHWSTIRIKFSTYVKGRIGWHGLKSDEFIDEGAYLVTGTDFENNRIDWSRCYHVTLERYAQDPYIQLQNGDLLITKDGTIGKTAIVSDLQGYATLNSGIFLTRPLRQDYLPEFLCWVLNSNCFYDYVSVSQTGTTINHLYQWTFENFAFQLPPIAEQKQIARFLDHETTRIDTLITKKRQLIDLLQKKRDAIIYQAVTKGLDPTVSLKDSGIPWIGNIPGTWEVRKLKFIASSLGVGVVIQPSSYVEEGGEVPFILGSDISEGCINVENARRISKESNLKLKQTMLRANDLVCVRVGEPGITAVVPPELDGINCASVMIVRQAKRFDSYWLCYVMNSSLGKANITLVAYGAAQKQFNISHAVDFLYPFPSNIEDQKRISAELDQKLKSISEAILKIKEQLKGLGQYRQSLITSAVTGKIDVREEVN